MVGFTASVHGPTPSGKYVILGTLLPEEEGRIFCSKEIYDSHDAASAVLDEIVCCIMGGVNAEQLAKIRETLYD